MCFAYFFRKKISKLSWFDLQKWFENLLLWNHSSQIKSNLNFFLFRILCSETIYQYEIKCSWNGLWVVYFQYFVQQTCLLSKMVVITKNRFLAHLVFTFKSSLLKPLHKFKLNLGGTVLGWSPFPIVSDIPTLLSRWWPLLKIEISLVVNFCFITNQNELKF